MARSTDAEKHRLAELKKEVTARGFNTHASLLRNISELPTKLQSPAVAALAAHENIQAVIMFPPQIQRGWCYVPGQALLFTDTGVTHLLASIWPDEEPQVTCIQGYDLVYMKVTLLLLYGFLEIVAQEQDTTTRFTMEFNTVAWDGLSPFLQQLLQATGPKQADMGEKASRPHARQALRDLPSKFSNGAKIYGLLPGEELEELVFQPDVWKSRWYFFPRPILANTLLLLTSNYLVVIQEELGVKQGWLLSYIPRKNIIEIQNRPGQLWNELSVQMTRGGQPLCCTLRLQSEVAEAWRERWSQHGGRWQEVPKPSTS